MIFSDSEYKKHSETTSWKELYKSRRDFWPDINEKGKSYLAKKNSWETKSKSNMWTIGEQYYSLAWSLFTLGYVEQLDLPYRGNISSSEDVTHQELLKNRIYNNNWGYIQILGNSHLACELSMKSLALHTAESISRAQYPKTHDLKKIFDSLSEEIKVEFKREFNEWSMKASSEEKFKDIIHNSGKRFLEHRYNHPSILNSTTLGTLGLSRFIYEVCFDA